MVTVETAQKALAEEVFQYAADSRKAAGRALGTLVEIITFYTLCTWDFLDHVAIERPVPEFANSNITHNVEFSLHHVLSGHKAGIERVTLPVTAKKIQTHSPLLQGLTLKSVQLVSTDWVKRNAAVLFDDKTRLIIGNLDAITQLPSQQNKSEASCRITVCELTPHPFAVFECKRVGVEEGMRKGPQTIEKAKQGAYVARTISSLQKLRLRSGHFQGVIERSDGTFRSGPYEKVVRQVIDSASAADSAGFILTIGVVSNHGNWFTAENANKELRVLAQSYDWLLFLTDDGLCQFVDRFVRGDEMPAAYEAFRRSYPPSSGNRFTKVRMDVDADAELRSYFNEHRADVESWFNVIAPSRGSLAALRSDLHSLASKTQ